MEENEQNRRQLRSGGTRDNPTVYLSSTPRRSRGRGFHTGQGGVQYWKNIRDLKGVGRGIANIDRGVENSPEALVATPDQRTEREASFGRSIRSDEGSGPIAAVRKQQVDREVVSDGGQGSGRGLEREIQFGAVDPQDWSAIQPEEFDVLADLDDLEKETPMTEPVNQISDHTLISKAKLHRMEDDETRLGYDQELQEVLGDEDEDLLQQLAVRMRAEDKGKKDFEDSDDLMYNTPLERRAIHYRAWITSRMRLYARNPVVNGDGDTIAKIRKVFKQWVRIREQVKDERVRIGRQRLKEEHENEAKEHQAKQQALELEEPYAIGTLRIPVKVLDNLEKDGLNASILKQATTFGEAGIRRWLKQHPKCDITDFFQAFIVSVEEGIALDDVVRDDTEDESEAPRTIPFADPFDVNAEYQHRDSHRRTMDPEYQPGIGANWETRVQWQRWLNEDVERGHKSRYVDQGVLFDEFGRPVDTWSAEEVQGMSQYWKEMAATEKSYQTKNRPAEAGASGVNRIRSASVQ